MVLRSDKSSLDDGAVSAETCSTHLVNNNNIQVYVCSELEKIYSCCTKYTVWVPSRYYRGLSWRTFWQLDEEAEKNYRNSYSV